MRAHGWGAARCAAVPFPGRAGRRVRGEGGRAGRARRPGGAPARRCGRRRRRRPPHGGSQRVKASVVGGLGLNVRLIKTKRAGDSCSNAPSLRKDEGGPVASVVPRRAGAPARAAGRAARVSPGERARVHRHAPAESAQVQEEERQEDLHGEGAAEPDSTGEHRMLRNLLEVDPSRREERRKRFSRNGAPGASQMSLNLATRQRNLRRITEENKKLLQRIINCEPAFDRHSFKQREKEHKALMRRMAENSGNRARPQSARGRPAREYAELASVAKKKKKKKGSRRRPKSAARSRQPVGADRGFGGGAASRSRRPRTSMGMRREKADLY